MMLTALQASAYLHHLNLRTPDVKRLATFYAEVMDMELIRLDGEEALLVGQAGDTVEVSIEGIGRLTNPIVSEADPDRT